MKSKSIKTQRVSLYIAGEYIVIRAIAYNYCREVGLCVTVTQCDYVHSDGVEFGVIIVLNAYPRFPKTDISHHAEQLGLRIKKACNQMSFMVQSDDITTWYYDARKIEDVEK